MRDGIAAAFSNGDHDMNMTRDRLGGLAGAAAAAMVLVGCAAYAQGPPAKPGPTTKFIPCDTLKNQKACAAKRDCFWVAAKKTSSGPSPAYCSARPKPATQPTKK